MKEDSLLSFKWQRFSSHLVYSLDSCYEKQQFVDLSLVCKDGTILKCHKMVLANSSSFFRRLLLAYDHPHPMIVLHDIEADDLKTIVNFMYCGEIQVVQSEVRRLLKLAEILEVTGLRHIPSSFLFDGSNNKEQYDALKKTTVSRLKLEETKNSSGKNVGLEHETGTKIQTKVQIQAQTQQTRFSSRLNSYKTTTKVPQETSKNEEINISKLCQRLETSNSGISIIDINEPSTSSGVRRMSPLQRKRKEFPTHPEISWQSVLSTMTNKPLSLEKVRCIMDEVEITAGKPSTSVSDNKINEPLDRRKVKKNSSEDNNLNTVYIKDEIEISSDMEEDVDMDPLEVDEIDNENSESSKSAQQFFSQILVHSLNKNTHPHMEFSSRKDSNS